jgi:hypothetical protein
MVILVVLIFFAWFLSQNYNSNTLVIPPIVKENPHLRYVNIKPNSIVTSPLEITGEASTWYFEASFPIKIYDANGKLLGSVPAQAQGDWMTTNFVAFKATLSFETPTTDSGTLVLQKDNPSGISQYDEEVRIPILFKK